MKSPVSIARYAASAMLLWATGASAQFDQTISVDGRYVPEYIGREKIGMFPRPERFSINAGSLDFDRTGVVAAFPPQPLPLEATGWRTSRLEASRGYIDAGLGSWLNSTLSFGYTIIDDSDISAGVRFQHNSTSLWNPEMFDGSDVCRQRYDERIGFRFADRFDAGTLSADAGYHFGRFNYYGVIPSDGQSIPETSEDRGLWQTLNDVDARVRWDSPASSSRQVGYYAGAGARYFGWNRIYTVDASTLKGYGGVGETNISLLAGLDWNYRKSAIGLDVTGNYLIYGKSEDSDCPYNYGAMSFTPWYRLNLDHFRMKLGIRADLTVNAGALDNRQVWLALAPVAEFDYTKGKFGIFLHLLGGEKLSTFASQYESDYYCMPGFIDTTPLYRPLDGDFGFRLGSFGGFEASADIAFRVSLNERTGGWYTAFLSPSATAPAMFGGAYDGVMPALSDMLYDNMAHLFGFSVGLHLAYDAGPLFRISAEGRYQPQDGEYGYFNGFDRPQWTLRVEADTNPWRRLKFKLALDCRGARAIYAGAETDIPYSESRNLEAYALPDLISLDFGASYGVTDRTAVWVQADNLLNRRNLLLPGCPTPGISLAAGVSIGF